MKGRSERERERERQREAEREKEREGGRSVLIPCIQRHQNLEYQRISQSQYINGLLTMLIKHTNELTL